MSEMVKRVSAAIRDCEKSHDGSIAWIEHCARCAILAMLEPTEAMRSAGERFVPVGHVATEKYKSMILAALEDAT